MDVVTVGPAVGPAALPVPSVCGFANGSGQTGSPTVGGYGPGMQRRRLRRVNLIVEEKSAPG